LKLVDNRGLVCPEPVIQTKKALSTLEGEGLVCLVDNPISRENVLKFAKSQGYTTTVSEEGGVFTITIAKKESETKQEGRFSVLHSALQTVYFVTADELGRGDSALGRTLMKSFFYALSESEETGGHLLFVHAGAKLTCQGSEVLPSLERLTAKGFTIKTCGLCLDYYDLKDKLASGEVTNMYAIIETLQQATKVISL